MSTRRDFLVQAPAIFASAALPSIAVAAGEAVTAAPDAYTQQLEAARSATGVTGASFAYWDGGRLHTAVAGLRNSVTGDPVTVDTVMHTGSITKIANATLLMQLVDDGKVSLDDPLLKHLPDFRTRDRASLEKITVRMLINHTSGIDGEWFREYGPDRERIVDTIERCADIGQLFAPGTETSYNNVATVIAGYLSQTLRGESWYTLVKSRIYKPLGMQHALVDPLDVPRYRASIGDLTNHETGKMFQTSRPFLATSFAPAGSTQMTTATDLATFARALVNGGVGENGARILTEASARLMLQRTADFVTVGTEVRQVGLGWMIQPGGVVSHGGGGPGVQSNLVAHPATGRVAVLLTNCDKGNRLAEAFLDPLVRSWSGLPEPAKPVRTAVGDVSPYVGSYENNADRYVVAADPAGVALRYYDKLSTYDNSDQAQPAEILHPVGNDTFEGENRTARFVRPDASGKMRFIASGLRLLARVA